MSNPISSLTPRPKKKKKTTLNTHKYIYHYFAHIMHSVVEYVFKTLFDKIGQNIK